LKRRHAIIGILLIFASTFIIEHYMETRYPVEELTITGLQIPAINEQRVFTYEHELEEVGTYSYTITGLGDGTYSLNSVTNVSYIEANIQIWSSYKFGEDYNPVDYSLKADQNGAISKINITFSQGVATSTVSVANETVTSSSKVTDMVLLAENNMPGYWELLLLSANLTKGQRYSAQVYIPQGGGVFDLEFYVDPSPRTITIGGERLSCLLIQESTLDLKFYIYEGRLVKMRNDDVDIVFTLKTG